MASHGDTNKEKSFAVELLSSKNQANYEQEAISDKIDVVVLSEGTPVEPTMLGNAKSDLQIIYPSDNDVNGPLSSPPNPVNYELHASLDKADDSVIN
jgi:hypothetical protein